MSTEWMKLTCLFVYRQLRPRGDFTVRVVFDVLAGKSYSQEQPRS
jgi:hypothetical protein